MEQTDKAVSAALVEDDEFFRATLESWLRGHPGLRLIGSYANGETALQQLRLSRADLAIIDLRLPGIIQGGELIWRLKSERPAPKVLVITMLVEEETILDAFDAGADGLWDKDGLDRRCFFEKIDKVLSGSHPLSEQAANLLFQRYLEGRPKPWVMDLLSHRERAVADLASRGWHNEGIASQLGISCHTVRTHKQHIFLKLHVQCQDQLQAKLFGLRWRSGSSRF